MSKKIEIINANNMKNIPYTHYHNDNEIIFVNKGSSEFKINDKIHNLKENSMIIIGNLEKHSMKITSDIYERDIIKISGSYKTNIIPTNIFMKLFQKRPKDFPYVFRFDGENLQEIKYITNKLKNRDQSLILDTNYSNILLCQLLILIVRNNTEYFFKKQSKLEEEILEIQEYLNENYNKNITLENLEKKYYISKFTISREFKLMTGYNFKQYIILLRMSKAKNLLIYTNKNIKEIAREVGYDVDNMFIRIFKKYEDLTPTQFRNKFKNNS